MKKEITIAEVERLAKLSRIEFTPTQLQNMQKHLESVLGYFETLDGVDISDVPPTAHILSSTNVLRDDTVEPSMDRELLLCNAPKVDDGAFVVPRVVE